jgi:hypothetical protein
LQGDRSQHVAVLAKGAETMYLLQVGARPWQDEWYSATPYYCLLGSVWHVEIISVPNILISFPLHNAGKTEIFKNYNLALRRNQLRDILDKKMTRRMTAAPHHSRSRFLV